MSPLHTELQEAVRRAVRSVPDLAAVLEAAEARRRRLRPHTYLRLLALPLPFAGFILGSWIGLAVGALPLIAYWIWYSDRLEELVRTVKERAVVPAVRALGLRFQEEVPADLESRQRSVLFEVFSPTRVNFHHSVVGAPGGRTVQVTHAIAVVRLGRGWERTVFSGLVATASASAAGQQVLVVREMGVLGAVEDVKRRLLGMKRAELPDPTFEALYTVYAQSEGVPAVLHASLRDVLVQLGQVPGTRPVVAFREGHVHVFLPRRAWLNPAVWSRVSEDALSWDLQPLLQAAFLVAVAAGASPQEVLASVREPTA